MLNKIREAVRKRVLYNQTRAEIARMPREIAFDLNIFPADADKIAYAAVYGRTA